MKRGKRLSVSLEEQKSALESYKHLFKTDTIPNSESQVYKNVSRTLHLRISPKALYLSVKRNFHYFFQENVVCSDVGKCENDIRTDSSSTSSNESNVSTDSTNLESDICTFDIELKDWDLVKPIEYMRKRYDPLKCSYRHYKRKSLPTRKWTNIFSEFIWKNTSNKCVWVYKDNLAKDDYTVKLNGSCKVCGAKLQINTEKLESTIRIYCHMSNVDNKQDHGDIKNRLTSHKKKEIAIKLENEFPIVLRNKMINKHVKDTETQEPPFIPKLKSLQNIRNQNFSQYYHKIVIVSLWIMTLTEPFKTIIRKFSVFPFIVYYWTQLQLDIYKSMASQSYTVLSIDATGSIFKNIIPPIELDKSYKPKHLFLYIVLMKIKNGSVPLCQMISETHTLDSIYDWLRTWIKNMKNKPDEVVSDDSSALIGAITRAFTRFDSLKDYLKQCFLILESGKGDLPECFIRLDTSHWVKNLYGLNCFKFVDKRVKDYYVKYLLILKSCCNYREAKQIIINLVIVALHRFDSLHQNNDKSRCAIAKEELKEMAKYVQNMEILTDPEENGDKAFNLDDIETEDFSIISWFDKIVATEKLHSDISDETDHDNLHYLPSFIDSLRKIIAKIPLWTNVMVQYFKSPYQTATSSNIESYFKNIKTLLLNNRKGLLKVDDFIKRHIDYLSGELKTAKCIYSSAETESPNPKNEAIKPVIKEEFTQESIFANEPIPIENWRNKAYNNVPLSLRDKTEPKKRSHKVDLLPNGSISNSGVDNIVVKNTCAFDSIAQAFVVACLNSQLFFDLIRSEKCDFFKLICHMVQKDYNVNILKLRTNIVSQHYPSIKNGNLTLIDCICNVTYILEKILFGEIYSTCTTKTCDACDHSFQRYSAILSLNVVILADKGLLALEESASSMIKEEISPCNNNLCNGNTTLRCKTSDYAIFFELDENLVIKDIPTEINLQNKSFTLTNVIEYIPGGNGHYRAHCKLNEKWEQFDDMTKKVTRSTTTKTITCHLLMYIRV